jgi:hypothetical protein
MMQGGVAITRVSLKSRTINATGLSSYAMTLQLSHRTLRRRSVRSDEGQIGLNFSSVFHPSNVAIMRTASLVPSMVCRQ